jgi:AraC-like DNA-binding protein
MKYISVNLYRKVIDYALAEGMSQGDFKDIPISVDALNEIQAVPADDFFRLHEIIDEFLPTGFSVRVGQEMKIEDYGVLGLSWKTCIKAGEIFERCERYFHLLSNTYVFKVEKEGEISRIHLFRDAYRRGVELSNEATFSATVVVLKAMTETDIAPVSVSFKHREPKDMSSYHKSFNCPVLFNQRHNFITYSTADLETRTVTADLSINKFLVERVEEQTRGIEISAGKIAIDVEKLIRDALPSGIPGLTQLAEQMGLSSRTLTRRLAETGLTFRSLIEKIQQEISRELLKNPSITIGEIAYQTGFSEQSAFNRAFKRWTGQTPLEYRKNI